MEHRLSFFLGDYLHMLLGRLPSLAMQRIILIFIPEIFGILLLFVSVLLGEGSLT